MNFLRSGMEIPNTDPWNLSFCEVREQHFYYGHPQNRFWKVIAALTKNETPETMEEKKRLLLKSGIAVWM